MDDDDGYVIENGDLMKDGIVVASGAVFETGVVSEDGRRTEKKTEDMINSNGENVDMALGDQPHTAING